MRAVQLIQVGKPLELREVPINQPAALDVIIDVKAAGICHSDAHYRAGTSPAYPLPLTLGHEVSGIVVETGSEVKHLQSGMKVCIHYLVTCGNCFYCLQGSEQFCSSGKMIGKHRDGGYAEFITVPARSVFPIPEEIPYPSAAIMMCSSATSLHAINKARLKPGESVAVFGIGGLGFSAVQIARAFGASQVFAIDINAHKLSTVERFGAVPINASKVDPVAEILSQTNNKGVDVSLELVGAELTARQSVLSLAPMGRAAIVGLSQKLISLNPYLELINKEAEVIGISDHLAQEIPLLIELVKTGKLNLDQMISQTLPLKPEPINKALDQFSKNTDMIRTIIQP